MKEFLIWKVSFHLIKNKGDGMAKGNSNNKQKEKLEKDLIVQVEKISNAFESIRDSIVSLQEGENAFPYWNGENACTTFKTLLGYVNNSYALVDYINGCQQSIKN